MMVSDASPLILLAKCELLEMFLDGLVETLMIPPHVQVECCGSKDTFDAQLIGRLISEKRIIVRRVGNRTLATRIRREFNLGRGEAEAIALAQSMGSQLVIMEDRNGVNACKVLKLPFTGVLGILLRMHEKKSITAEESLQKLDVLRKYGRYKPEIVSDVRRLLEKKR